MGKSKVRTLLMACVMIMLCAAMIVGGTYALWSDNVNVTNHLSAGTLKVSLYRTYYEKHTLGDDMYMTDEPNSETVNFSESTTANVFGLRDNELIVPTSSYAARLKLTNDGDVAIDYTVKIVVDGNKSSKDLAKQLKVYIGTGEANNVTYDAGRYLATEDDENGVQYLTYAVYTGVMDKNVTEKEFWVKVVFEDRNDNNDAKSKEVYFDLLVEATQKTTQATA